MELRTRPGRPFPLGAQWDGEGTNFALFSQSAVGVDLCLISEDGAERQVPLEESTSSVWHGFLPQVGPGQRYGFRVRGPFEPAQGHRFDASQLLIDPYARAIDDGVSVVVQDESWSDDGRPAHAWADTVIYELHVKGFTARHPDVPEQLRGTYAGLAHPAAINYLKQLGVTAVELMPVHHFVSEPALVQRGLTNYWGYNSIGYFAPHAGYSASGTRGEQVREFKEMVRSLHAAGLEVLLDVVFNHTAEGDETGATLSFRGIDNRHYYRLEQDGSYRDYTGCGNTLDTQNPQVLQLLMDSLRYWVTEMHVDGFRFDLASALARSTHEVDKLSAFFAVIQQDPVVSRVKLIAEPWDLGEGGYQVGGFPPPWTEWNDQYRDAVRDAWRGQSHGLRGLAYRLSGSSDLYQDDGRGPCASINFVTSHDGFTLRDLTTYEHKQNLANGEDNRDGEDHNRSWNCGAEGETDDPQVNALRIRQAKNLLATLLLSTGVPMLSMGDELRRTQGGNNNAYCQDNETSWVDWEADAGGLPELVRQLLALRREHPVFRQQAFFSGRALGDDGVKDLAWFGAHGQELTDDEWFDPSHKTLCMYVDGRGIRTRDVTGERIVDDSFLLVLHTGADDVDLTLPGHPWALSYELLLDTAAQEQSAARPGVTVPMTGRSVRVYQACR